jgi:hypothetical protein
MKIQGPDGKHTTAVGRVVVLQGDHFELQPVDLPGFEATTAGSWMPVAAGTATETQSTDTPKVGAVWDRASLVALEPADRKR